MDAALEQVLAFREPDDLDMTWLPWRIRVLATATVEKRPALSGTTLSPGPFSPGTNPRPNFFTSPYANSSTVT
jgi:hypothetical protein